MEKMTFDFFKRCCEELNSIDDRCNLKSCTCEEKNCDKVGSGSSPVHNMVSQGGKDEVEAGVKNLGIGDHVTKINKLLMKIEGERIIAKNKECVIPSDYSRGLGRAKDLIFEILMDGRTSF